jgi:hypothetical protein
LSSEGGKFKRPFKDTVFSTAFSPTNFIKVNF